VIWIVIAAAMTALGWLLGTGTASANWDRARDRAAELALLLLLGACGGWLGRDRVRLRWSYASPSRAWGGKTLFFLSGAAALTASASPVSWPETALPGCAALAACGLAVWLGNLPQRL
jgi:hypothetical protein